MSHLCKHPLPKVISTTYHYEFHLPSMSVPPWLQHPHSHEEALRSALLVGTVRFFLVKTWWCRFLEQGRLVHICCCFYVLTLYLHNKDILQINWAYVSIGYIMFSPKSYLTSVNAHIAHLLKHVKTPCPPNYRMFWCNIAVCKPKKIYTDKLCDRQSRPWPISLTLQDKCHRKMMCWQWCHHHVWPYGPELPWYLKYATLVTLLDIIISIPTFYNGCSIDIHDPLIRFI